MIFDSFFAHGVHSFECVDSIGLGKNAIKKRRDWEFFSTNSFNPFTNRIRLLRFSAFFCTVIMINSIRFALFGWCTPIFLSWCRLFGVCFAIWCVIRLQYETQMHFLLLLLFFSSKDSHRSSNRSKLAQMGLCKVHAKAEGLLSNFYVFLSSFYWFTDNPRCTHKPNTSREIERDVEGGRERRETIFLSIEQ